MWFWKPNEEKRHRHEVKRLIRQLPRMPEWERQHEAERLNRLLREDDIWAVEPRAGRQKLDRCISEEDAL